MNAKRTLTTIDMVMPAFNEAAGIEATIRALFRAVTGLPYRFELIVVDDGSCDDTVDVVRRLQPAFPIRLISLTRNFGKESALLAGLDLARGDATILLDADLQHPVELIARFVEQWREGYECVYAVRRNRQGEWLGKRILARMFYFGVNRGSRFVIPPNGLDFRLLDRNCVQALCSLRERVRFTKGLYAWLGFRSIAVAVDMAPRLNGKSRFNARTLAQLGWDGLTSFSDWPLKAAVFSGFGVALAALAYAGFIVMEALLFGIDVPGWATLAVVLMLLGGLQLLFLGILGQYVRNVFIETKRRPSYLVREFSSSVKGDSSAPAIQYRPGFSNVVKFAEVADSSDIASFAR